MLNRPLDIVNKKLFISEDRSTGLRGRATDWEPSGCCCFGALTFASNRFQSTAGALNYRRSWQRNSFRYIADKQNNYIALRIQRRLSSTLFCYPLPSSRPLTACDDYRRPAKLLVFSGRNEFSPAQQQWCGGDVTKLIYWLEIVNQPHGTRQATISDEPTAAPNTRPFSWIKLLQTPNDGSRYREARTSACRRHRQKLAPSPDFLLSESTVVISRSGRAVLKYVYRS